MAKCIIWKAGSVGVPLGACCGCSSSAAAAPLSRWVCAHRPLGRLKSLQGVCAYCMSVTLEWLFPTPCRSNFHYSFLRGCISYRTSMSTTACGSNKVGVIRLEFSRRILGFGIWRCRPRNCQLISSQTILCLGSSRNTYRDRGEDLLNARSYNNAL